VKSIVAAKDCSTSPGAADFPSDDANLEAQLLGGTNPMKTDVDSLTWKSIDSFIEESKWTWDDDTFEAEYDKFTEREKLCKELADWSISHNIANKSLTSLLKILHKHGLDVPLQGQTLVQTPKNIALEKKSGGEYYNFGLKESIKTALQQCHRRISSIQFKINIDGLPTFK
jgi:hypothetical protein